MADGGDGFMRRCEVFEQRRRGKRRWSTKMKARIVVESLQPGVRVCDVTARYDILPHHLSDWRRHARQDRLVLPSDLMDALTTSPSSAVTEPAFVPLSILPDAVDPQGSAVVEVSQNGRGVMTIKVGPDLRLRIPSKQLETKLPEITPSTQLPQHKSGYSRSTR